MNLNENISRIREMMGLISEQVSPVGQISKSESCGITRACEKEDREFQKSSSKELKIWDQQVRAQERQDAREKAIENKNFLSLSYNRNSDPLDRQTKKIYQQQFQDFIQKNPNLLNNSEGFSPEQKYAIISKTLDFIKKVPDISYSSRLKKKYGLTPASTLNDVIDVVNKMGGWTLYMDWFNSGGPEIK